MKLPELSLSLSLIDTYFDTCSPYLINLSLCLLCKCLSKGVIPLTSGNIGWLLGISLVVAYKVYYD